MAVLDRLRLFTIQAALDHVKSGFFNNNPVDARTVLSSVPDACGLLARLLAGGCVRAAGRLSGALRNIGKERMADEIVSAMTASMRDVGRLVHVKLGVITEPVQNAEQIALERNLSMTYDRAAGPVQVPCNEPQSLGKNKKKST